MNQAERYHDSLQHRSALKSWLAVLAVALGAFVFVTSEFLPIGLLTQISAGLHVSDGIAGLMVTCYVTPTHDSVCSLWPA
jgi:predicted MFS family arabinose efflux permease